MFQCYGFTITKSIIVSWVGNPIGGDALSGTIRDDINFNKKISMTILTVSPKDSLLYMITTS
jgi:hypothetical protein